MKAETGIDAIDTSWTWTVEEDLFWDGDVLASDLPDDPPFEPGRSYRPLREHTALFIEFSETKPTRAGILNFANSYGSLSYGVPEEMTKQDWVNAISEMRGAVTLWRAIEGATDSHSLYSAAETFFAFKIGTPPGLIESRIATLKKLANNRAELLDYCKSSLRFLVNEMLRKHVTRAQVALTRNEDFQLTFRPADLHGALWLQFAQAMAHNYNIKVCRGCGKPFQAGAGGNRRSDATTCSDACRQKAFRKEQEQAEAQKAAKRK